MWIQNQMKLCSKFNQILPYSEVKFAYYELQQVVFGWKNLFFYCMLISGSFYKYALHVHGITTITQYVFK